MTACCLRIAVLLPCLDEEAAIAGVVKAFRQALPNAQVYVYDNGSTDATAERALEAGAVVRSEPLRGKGNVVRRMFADVDADVYILADGDGTYDASAAPAMVDRLIAGNLDMVVGVRVEAEGQDAYRPGHEMGNALLNRMIRGLFGGVFTDISSGYRVMSRRLVKSFPALSQRFEIEPELAAHCAHLRLPCAEMPTRYVERPEGSESKLNTLKDGRRALLTIGLLVKEFRPFQFFTVVAATLSLVSLVLAVPIVLTFWETGLVPRLPTAVLCASLALAAMGSFLSGIILDSVNRGRHELKRMAYLCYPPFARPAAPATGRPEPAPAIAKSPFPLTGLTGVGVLPIIPSLSQGEG